MMIKDSTIILEKSDIGLLLDGKFRDVKAITEKGLRKLWLNRHEDVWKVGSAFDFNSLHICFNNHKF